MFEFMHRKFLLGYMETHLVDWCNLKCDYCGHYCHIIDEEIYTDVTQFEKDIKILSSKINFRMIRLMGGEPLLHPEVNKFLTITRRFFPNSDIRIVTNGILIPNMKQEFWDTLKRTKIRIDISKYPIMKNKFNDITDLIVLKGARIGNIEIKDKFYHKLNENGDADKEKSYNACASRNAINLWNGKLYNCQACYRYYYNKKYNKNIPLPPSVDIRKLSGKKIYEFFTPPPRSNGSLPLLQ